MYRNLAVSRAETLGHSCRGTVRQEHVCEGVDVQNVEARGAGAKKASSLGRCEGVGPWTVCIVL